MPMRLDEGWNQIQFNLGDFTSRAYNTVYIETLRVQIHASCRIRRIFFSSRLYEEEELPPQFKIWMPQNKQKGGHQHHGMGQQQAHQHGGHGHPQMVDQGPSMGDNMQHHQEIPQEQFEEAPAHEEAPMEDMQGQDIQADIPVEEVEGQVEQ